MNQIIPELDFEFNFRTNELTIKGVVPDNYAKLLDGKLLEQFLSYVTARKGLNK